MFSWVPPEAWLLLSILGLYFGIKNIRNAGKYIEMKKILMLFVPAFAMMFLSNSMIILNIKNTFFFILRRIEQIYAIIIILYLFYKGAQDFNKSLVVKISVLVLLADIIIYFIVCFMYD